jgi:hypothetical protein
MEMGNYAIVNAASGVVENVITWDGESQWSAPDGFIAVMTDEAGIGWSYLNGQFSPPNVDGPTDDEMADSARRERDRLLRDICDQGILMAQRAIRLATTPEETTYAEGKIVELDAYAEALVAIPDQPGFPNTITWPVAPTK